MLSDIDYLLLAGQNIGKIGALQMIARFAPGEIIAYTDDDVFFLPGWLDTHLKIIDTYPGWAWSPASTSAPT